MLWAWLSSVRWEWWVKMKNLGLLTEFFEDGDESLNSLNPAC